MWIRPHISADTDSIYVLGSASGHEFYHLISGYDSAGNVHFEISLAIRWEVHEHAVLSAMYYYVVYAREVSF